MYAHLHLITTPLCPSAHQGVGLCHGISGNAYCFLDLHRGRKLLEQRIKRSSSNSSGSNSGEKMSNSCNDWLSWAHHFAKFGLDNIGELFYRPDHPFSLYEGISGLIFLLHDLKDPDHAQFPCLEHRAWTEE